MKTIVSYVWTLYRGKAMVCARAWHSHEFVGTKNSLSMLKSRIQTVRVGKCEPANAR